MPTLSPIFSPEPINWFSLLLVRQMEDEEGNANELCCPGRSEEWRSVTLEMSQSCTSAAYNNNYRCRGVISHTQPSVNYRNRLRHVHFFISDCASCSVTPQKGLHRLETTCCFMKPGYWTDVCLSGSVWSWASAPPLIKTHYVKQPTDTHLESDKRKSEVWNSTAQWLS